MSYNTAFSAIHSIDKLNNDLLHLKKIGEILSIEICIGDEFILDDDTLGFIQGTEGFYYISGDVFINMQETELFKIDFLFNMIYLRTGSLEAIDGITIHMRSPYQDSYLYYSVEITENSYLPRIISVQDSSLYFQFLNSFHLLWETTKIRE